MGRTLPKRIVDYVFRTGPDFELAPIEGLSPEIRARLATPADDPDVYGVLVARLSGRVSKAISRDTGLLLAERTTPGTVQHHIGSLDDEHFNVALAAMVLDGVLEIEEDGRFLSGVSACDRIFPQETCDRPEGFLARLSEAALRYAQALGIDDAERVSSRLYAYNRLPYDAYWGGRFGCESSISKFLQISESSRWVPCDWGSSDQTVAGKAWLGWKSRRCERATGGWKLYVSPRPEEMPDVLRIVMQEASDVDVAGFKVACHCAGLLRPDKFVLYLRDFNSLRNVALSLTHALSGCRGHGVPFTAAITDDGLLSFGMDPSTTSGLLRSPQPTSWRTMIADQLATSLVAAMNEKVAPMEPWQFALRRLCLNGVDVDTWEPIETASFMN